jgi:aminopeptidase YwaD
VPRTHRSAAEPERLRAHVAALEGERHPVSSPGALEAATQYVERGFQTLGLEVERHPFPFDGSSYDNVVATKPGVDSSRPRVLVGAHFDTVHGSPGADDNASGVGALLEVARLLSGVPLASNVDFVGFNLEEPQGVTYRVGSRAFAKEARRRRVRYVGAFILEMLGYTNPRRGSQSIPPLLFWKRVPHEGTFLAATGHGGSARLLKTFAAAAREAVPALTVVTFRTPLRGWLVPDTRLSDNASFWDAGYPALMLTDTAYLRNPHYHRASDRLDTLDLGFLAQATDAVAAAVTRVAGSHDVRLCKT